MADTKKVSKILDLFRHTDKDDSGDHISPEGRTLANDTGANYNGITVHHGFCGPLPRTNETLIAMMMNNPSFDDTMLHDPIDGLGSKELFATMITDVVKKSIREDKKSNMDGVISNHDEATLAAFENAGRDALKTMFDLMDEGQHGVGAFHDPTIPMLAQNLGMKEAESLPSMGGIRFVLYDDGTYGAFALELE